MTNGAEETRGRADDRPGEERDGKPLAARPLAEVLKRGWLTGKVEAAREAIYWISDDGYKRIKEKLRVVPPGALIGFNPHDPGEWCRIADERKTGHRRTTRPGRPG